MTIKCDGCEFEMRSGDFVEVSQDDGGTYVVTYTDDSQEQVHYCYDCRDIVAMTIEADGAFETIVNIQSA